MTTSSVSPVTTELAGSETGITFIIHAGAGSRGKHSTPERIAQVELDLQRALDAGYQLLESGAPAHEAVVAAIHVMEDAPEFNAGRGAALTSDGIAQMDACLMTGDGEVGAVTGVSTVKNPIDAARAVKEQTKHVPVRGPDRCRDRRLGRRDRKQRVLHHRTASSVLGRGSVRWR